MSKNLLIVFEGIEGSGKTTHINYIAKYLKKNKKNYIKIREPGGSKNSEIIRRLILSNKSSFNNKTDLLLYLAARSENIDTLIKKNYRKKIILIDRFVDSTIAYQSSGMGLDNNVIKIINNFLLKNIKVDFTFLNLVNKENLKKRLNKRKKKNRYDKFDFNFYKKVQRGFLKISKKKRNYMIINSNKDIKNNKKIILNKVIQLIK
tara:strand:+ start:1853 stop:2467 length:615 start_codon:yes stop_codon:yes gene_type:complete